MLSILLQATAQEGGPMGQYGILIMILIFVVFYFYD